MSGIFITFEGPEGAGKSTNIYYLANRLEEAGYPILVTREPGGTLLSERVRDLLIDPRFKGMAVDTELLLIFAARAEHLQQVILPALKEGKTVICDRFTDATYAYQGGGRGIDENKITLLERVVQGTLRPDLTLLFDVDATIGLSRVIKSRDGLDRFERESLTFFEAVRAAYWRRAEQYPGIYRVIDASKSLENVQLQIDACFIEIWERLNVD
ncbi:dTMP kinase [Entomomonas asaccharolytica]|uniref:Thymidylate kinase n=1 Tax=Entomomonas asaccharolytica TaxID=2785331 RepID=A0A974NDB2_9GAMM|nr:dTMP kinase [Entomomonas asaccharolytica]QQP84505.1 dTMP kinase [Entomomonas asaccharolytica]